MPYTYSDKVNMSAFHAKSIVWTQEFGKKLLKEGASVNDVATFVAKFGEE